MERSMQHGADVDGGYLYATISLHSTQRTQAETSEEFVFNKQLYL